MSVGLELKDVLSPGAQVGPYQILACLELVAWGKSGGHTSRGLTAVSPRSETILGSVQSMTPKTRMESLTW
jgi:hypothetical protein